MQYQYKTTGTCSRLITIDYNENTHIINEITFLGGCPGNTKGVALLCKGRTLEDVSKLLKDVKCGNKPTSCPDQLSIACGNILKSL